MTRKKEPRMLTIREVAEKLNASPRAIRLWAKNGRFAGAELIEPPAGLPYWMIPEASLEGIENKGPGRPRKVKEVVKPEARKSEDRSKSKKV